MNAFWAYLWPALGLGAVCGVVAGAIGFRRGARRNLALAAGFACAILLAALWHWPLGGAARFETKVERGIRATLIYYEMTQVSAHLHQHPLTRRVLLSGPADDFQRSELARLMGQVPGVSSARWSGSGGGLPLIVQGCLGATVGFLFGLLLAYLVELRRRYNAQWNW